MSDLSKTTILEVSDNYLDIKIQEYIRDVDIVMNEQLKTNEVIRNATTLAFLMDLGIYYANTNNIYIPLAHYEGGHDQPIIPSAEYNIIKASEILERCDIIAWCLIAPDLTDNVVKMDYDDYSSRYTSEQALYLLSESYFVTRVYFKDRKWLLGFEPGMNYATSLDTWICDWL